MKGVRTMSEKRIVEIFSAECPACTEVIEQVRGISCSSCEIRVLDMNDPTVAARARELGVGSVPAVVVNGKLAAGTGGCIDLEGLKKAGVGSCL